MSALSSDWLSKQYLLEELEKGCKGTRPPTCRSWCLVAFRWNPYKIWPHSKCSPFTPLCSQCLSPGPWNANYALLPVSPLGTLFSQIFSCVILHTSLLPSFLASLYKIVPPANYIPLPYLIFHHSTWHCIPCVFANLLIVSVSHGDIRLTRAGTWPSSLHYPLCLEQKLALNELQLNICWLLPFTLNCIFFIRAGVLGWYSCMCSLWFKWRVSLGPRKLCLHLCFTFSISFW